MQENRTKESESDDLMISQTFFVSGDKDMLNGNRYTLGIIVEGTDSFRIIHSFIDAKAGHRAICIIAY